MSDNSSFKHNGSQNEFGTVQAGTIKSGVICMIKGFPCKVITVCAKNGAGKAKVSIEGTDLFTNKKHDEVFPSSGMINIPSTNFTQYEVADIDEDGFVSLVMADGSLKSQVKVPQDQNLYDQLMKLWTEKQDGQEVKFTVLKSNGQEKIISGIKIKSVS